MAAKKVKKKGGNIFRTIIAELKKVAWPNRREVSTYTVVVLVTVVAVAVIISAFDSILTLILSQVIKVR